MLKIIVPKVIYTSMGVNISEVLLFDSDNKDFWQSKERLASILDINESQIVKTSVEFFVDGDIKIEDLSVVLISLYSAALSGVNLIDNLSQTLESLYENDNINSKLKLFKQKGFELSKILDRLGVHKVVVSLVKAGEQTGDVAQALDEANDFLELDKQTKKASQTDMGISSVYLLLGLLLTLMSPIFIVDVLKEMSISSNKELDFFINYLQFMSDNVGLIVSVILTIAMLIAASFYIKRIHLILKKLPLMRNFDALSSIKKAIVFMPFYSALNQAGISDKKAMEMYQSIDKKSGLQLVGLIDQGKALPEALLESGTHKDIIDGIAIAINIDNIEARTKAFKGLIKLLTVKALKEGKKISNFLKFSGYFFIITGIFTIVTAYKTMVLIAL